VVVFLICCAFSVVFQVVARMKAKVASRAGGDR
jgi:hypothetical protein